MDKLAQHTIHLLGHACVFSEESAPEGAGTKKGGQMRRAAHSVGVCIVLVPDSPQPRVSSQIPNNDIRPTDLEPPNVQPNRRGYLAEGQEHLLFLVLLVPTASLSPAPPVLFEDVLDPFEYRRLPGSVEANHHCSGQSIAPGVSQLAKAEI